VRTSVIRAPRVQEREHNQVEPPLVEVLGLVADKQGHLPGRECRQDKLWLFQFWDFELGPTPLQVSVNCAEGTIAAGGLAAGVPASSRHLQVLRGRGL